MGDQLGQEHTQHGEGIAVLDGITAALSHSFDPAEMVERALDQVLATFSLAAGAVLLWDRMERRAEAYRGASAGLAQKMARLCREGERLRTELTWLEKPLVVEDIALEGWFDGYGEGRDEGKKEISAGELRSLACVPLVAREGRRIGALAVGDPTQGRFGPQDVQLLAFIGHQLGMAVENAQLYAAERNRADQLALIAQMGLATTSVLDLDRLLIRAVESVKKVFGYHRVALALVEGDQVIKGVDNGNPPSAWSDFAAGPKELVRRALSVGEPFFWDEAKEELILPLSVRDRLIGLLDIQSDSPIPFNDAELRLLLLLASQLAVTIDNAQLFQLTLSQGSLFKQRADLLAKVLATSDRLLGLSTRLDLLLDEIAHTVHESLGFNHVAVTVVDETGRTIQAKALAGLDGDAGADDFLNITYAWESLRQFMQPRYRISRSYFLKLRDRVPPQGFDESLPVSEPGQEKKWLAGDLLFTPIKRVDGQMVGLLSVDSPLNGQAPTVETAQALELFANQAAIALDNARLFQELERRLQETNALFQVGQTVVTSLDLDEVLTLIVDAALKTITTAQKVVIHLLDADGESLVPRAVSHHGKKPLPSAKMRVGKGIAGYAVAKKRALYVPDTEKEARFVDIGTGLRSLLVVPLVLGETVIGTLSVDSTEVDAFDPGDKRLLTMLANYAAIAIENARLYSEAKRADELAALNRISRAMTSTLDLDQVLASAMQGIDQTLRVEAGSLLLLDEKRGELVSRMILRGGELRDVPFRLALGQGIAGWVAREGKPLLVADVQGDDRFFAGLNEALELVARAILCVPLIVRDEVIGAIEIVNKLEGQFMEDDLALLSSIAASVAIAIENARLYTEVKGFAEELARSQAQLVQSAKLAATGKLAASIAHEINNPLQAVQSCIYLVADEIEPDSPDKQYLDIAREELSRISKIVERMVDFYRPSKEGRKPTDINSLLENVLTLMGKRIQQGQVIVNTRLASQLPPVMAIADHLKQVFFNIILNALEAMPKGGKLYVTTSLVSSKAEVAVVDEEEDFVQIEFTDTGVGIAPEVIGNLFAPFYTTKAKGTGLGLSISSDIVERHGGQVEVESEVGQGTTFTIKLPVAAAEELMAFKEEG